MKIRWLNGLCKQLLNAEDDAQAVKYYALKCALKCALRCILKVLSSSSLNPYYAL